MTSLIFFSISAIALKCLILIRFRHSVTNSSPWFKGLFASLFILNVIEFAAFTYMLMPPVEGLAIVILSLYYIVCFVAFYSMVALALNANNQLTTAISRVLIGLIALTCIPMLIPGFAVADVQRIGHSITRMAGEYYWLVQAGLALPLITALALLIKNSVSAEPYSRRRASIVLLVALAPMILACLLVIVLMAFEVKVNGSVFVSVSTCLTMLLFMFTQTDNQRYLLLCYIPFTRESRLLLGLVQMGARAIDNTKGYDDLLSEEKKLIFEALILSDFNSTYAAKRLNMNRTTFNRKVRQFGIKGNLHD